MTSPGCPPEDELVRMVEGALGDASLAAIERHVDTCERCAAVIAGLGALDGAAERRVVGRYQLDRKIGGGGMGEVWAAWDPQLRRDIAVKLVKPERADDGRERERLKREARALARLGHPNVLAVYDVGETEDEVFIATELVVGDTLASRGGANADWRALVKMYAQAARGLAAAHAAGLVHRDIKPANLLIGTDGRVRVADFGLAVRSATPSPVAPTELANQTGEAQVTQTGYIAGTPAYMAPEQRLGEPADARADQYALCVALVEGVAGRRPPLDIGSDAMIAFVGERRAREPDLDRLCRVMARGLSIDRDDRFPDMTAFADALDACVAPSATSTADVQPIPAVRPVRRRRALLLGIAATAAIGGVASVLVLARVFGGEDTATASSGQLAIGDTVAADAALDATAIAIADIDVDATAPAVMPNPSPGSGALTIKPPPRPSAPPAPRPTAIPSDVQSQIELGLAAARRAMLKRDGATCLAAIDALPANVPQMTAYNIELHRGQCEMLRGDCERGIQRVDAALEGMGSPPNGTATALAMCPITGPYEVRLARLVAQAHTARGLAACRAYLAPARTLAGEATTAQDKVLLGGVLRQLGRCVGGGGDCAEAEALWKRGFDLDQIAYKWDVEKCGAPPAATPAAPASPLDGVQALVQTVNGVQQSILHRDTRACRDFLAKSTADVPAGMASTVDLVAGYCQMMLGDCKAGTDRVAKSYGGSVGGVALASIADTYCPIAGTLEQRIGRMRAQLAAFADKRTGTGRIAWCSYLIGPAKTAAREAQSADHKERAAEILQHLAWCVSGAGRCGEAHDLWSLSLATDANADPAPKLSPKCP